MTGRWLSTGRTVEVPGQVDRIPPFDERAGEHLWVVLTAFRVAPERMGNGSHVPILDQETLLSLQGPACYYCEQPWSSLLQRRRCKGRP